MPAVKKWTVPGLVDTGLKSVGSRLGGNNTMGSTRRHFTEEYKANAVSLALDDGRTNAEVARSLGIHEMTFGKWVKKEREHREADKDPDAELDESERAELNR